MGNLVPGVAVARRQQARSLELLAPYHVDVKLLTAQEACFVYADEYLAWINYEGRSELEN
jgi:hypothetical protein